jgi:hypothetical protein
MMPAMMLQTLGYVYGCGRRFFPVKYDKAGPNGK